MQKINLQQVECMALQIIRKLLNPQTQSLFDFFKHELFRDYQYTIVRSLEKLQLQKIFVDISKQNASETDKYLRSSITQHQRKHQECDELVNQGQPNKMRHCLLGKIFQLLEYGLKIYPTNIEILYTLCFLKAEIKDHKASNKYISEILLKKQFAWIHQLHYKYSENLYQMNMPQQALQVIDKAINMLNVTIPQKQPLIFSKYLCLKAKIKAQLQGEQSELASNQFKLSLNPLAPEEECYLNYLQCLMMRNKQPEIQQLIVKYLNLFPNSKKAYGMLCYWALLKKDGPKIKQYLLKMNEQLSLSGESCSLFRYWTKWRWLVHSSCGNYQSAYQSMKKMKLSQREQIYQSYRIAMTCYYHGLYQQAIKYMQIYLTKVADSQKIYCQLMIASLYIQLLQKSKAKHIIDELQKKATVFVSYTALLYIQIKNCLVQPQRLIVTLTKMRYSFETEQNSNSLVKLHVKILQLINFDRLRQQLFVQKLFDQICSLIGEINGNAKNADSYFRLLYTMADFCFANNRYLKGRQIFISAIRSLSKRSKTLTEDGFRSLDRIMNERGKCAVESIILWS